MKRTYIGAYLYNVDSYCCVYLYVDSYCLFSVVLLYEMDIYKRTRRFLSAGDPAPLHLCNDIKKPASRDVRFEIKLGLIGTKWDKFGNFSDFSIFCSPTFQIKFQYILARRATLAPNMTVPMHEYLRAVREKTDFSSECPPGSILKS